MSDGYAADEPRHVEQAGIDEDVRQCAIYGAENALLWTCESVGQGRFDTTRFWPPKQTPARRPRVDRALRVLRHFGLLVEHGDGIVSIKETPNG